MSAFNQTTVTDEYLQESIASKILGVSIAFIPIVLIFAGLRLYSRHLSKIPLWLDDYIVIWSVFLQIGTSAIGIIQVKLGGLGRHLIANETLFPDSIPKYWKLLLSASFMYFFSVAWPKLAILALYYRLFGNTGGHKIYKYSIFLLAVVVWLTSVVACIWSLNLCHPFEANWQRELLETVPGAYCVNEQLFYAYGSLPNIITDVAMLILPLPIIWKLNMSRKNKWVLTVVFLIGSLGLTASILRFHEFIGGANATGDGTWDSTELMIWTAVEPDLYLITACLPTYRPLYRRFFGPKEPKANETPGRVTFGSRFLKGGRSNKHLGTFDLTETTAIGFTRWPSTGNGQADEESLHLKQHAGSNLYWQKDGGIRVDREFIVSSETEYGMRESV